MHGVAPTSESAVSLPPRGNGGPHGTRLPSPDRNTKGAEADLDARSRGVETEPGDGTAFADSSAAHLSTVPARDSKPRDERAIARDGVSLYRFSGRRSCNQATDAEQMY